MKVIALTGGIGSGKSYVAGIIEHFFPILHVSTDDLAKEQMKKGGISYDGVVEHFSRYGNLLTAEGELDRKRLSELVFEDERLLAELDSITHPNVLRELENIIAREKEREEYVAVLIESALVFESGIDSMCDEVWCVTAPVEVRKERLRSTRGYSDEKISSILDDQLADEEFISRSDRVILNDGVKSAEQLVEEINDILMSI